MIDWPGWKEKEEDNVNKLHAFEDDNDEDDGKSFTEFIKEKRKEYALEADAERIFVQDYADMLGLGVNMYQKIINKNKPGQSRDCIIAICITLRMSVKDTNKALRKYDMMPQLDSKNPREMIIINILKRVSNIEEKAEPMSIDSVNKILESNGYKPLEIIAHRNQKTNNNTYSENVRYKIFEKESYTDIDSLIHGSQYDSLETEYDFYRYQCHARMYLGDLETKQIYELYAEPDGSCSLLDQQFNSTRYKNAKEAGDFADYFAELQGMVISERQRMDAFLNDTKNYGERIGAGIHNGRIHIYYETYNYRVPEFNEYYLFEYIDGIFRLSVSSKSLFMQKNVSEKEYEEHYGKPTDTIKEQYDSIEDIEVAQEKVPRVVSSRVLNLRPAAYKKYKTKVVECLDNLRNRKEFVRNLDAIWWDDHDRVCRFFDVEETFDCEEDPEWGFIKAKKTEAVFRTSAGKKVKITLEELYRAFELGFDNITDVCDAKRKLGSVEAVLK